MGLSCAERQRKWRERQKEIDGDAFRIKCKEKARVYRSAMTVGQKARYTRMSAERMRMSRTKSYGQRKEMAEPCASSSARAYETAAALSKATNRAARCLPRSPTKKRAVVLQLARILHLDVRHTEPQTHNNGIPDGDRATARMFLESDNASRATPGKYDYVRVKDRDGAAEDKQVRYLLSSTLETLRRSGGTVRGTDQGLFGCRKHRDRSA